MEIVFKDETITVKNAGQIIDMPLGEFKVAISKENVGYASSLSNLFKLVLVQRVQPMIIRTNEISEEARINNHLEKYNQYQRTLQELIAVSKRIEDKLVFLKEFIDSRTKLFCDKN